MNKIFLAGKIEGELEPVKTDGASLYKTVIAVKRFSGVEDKIPVYFPEKVIEAFHSTINKDNKIRLAGTVEARHEKDSSHLNVYCYITDVSSYDYEKGDDNIFKIDMSLVKSTFRKTPLGRDICDFSVIVYSSPKISSYLPCIAWGRNAVIISKLQNRDELFCQGRFQSRKYIKALDDGRYEERTAYELSVNNLRIK